MKDEWMKALYTKLKWYGEFANKSYEYAPGNEGAKSAKQHFAKLVKKTKTKKYEGCVLIPKGKHEV